MLTYVIDTIRELVVADVPIFGICLGCQLLALTFGGDTYKLKFGHRGQNQTIVDVKTGKCYVTSQNHGFTVDRQSLPDELETIFLNANDNTVEGIRHKSLPIFAVQHHPEASPGPSDTTFLFDIFLEKIKARD
jgi:carbamoyl-phosphate synthase small subunit